MNNNVRIPLLSPQEAHLYMKQHPDTVLLDVRTAREHRERRIPGSIHLDRLEMTPQAIACTLPNRQPAVLVYCRSGIHSKAVVLQLCRMGYNAIELEGGLINWDYEIEGTLT